MVLSKKLLLCICVLFPALVSLASTTDDSITVIMQKSPNCQNYDDSENQRMPEFPGRRSKNRQIFCTFDKYDGLTFHVEIQPEIKMLEILDYDKNPLFVGTDEMDFINKIFILSGEFFIRIETDENIYIGEIVL